MRNENREKRRQGRVVSRVSSRVAGRGDSSRGSRGVFFPKNIGRNKKRPRTGQKDRNLKTPSTLWRTKGKRPPEFCPWPSRRRSGCVEAYLDLRIVEGRKASIRPKNEALRGLLESLSVGVRHRDFVHSRLLCRWLCCGRKKKKSREGKFVVRHTKERWSRSHRHVLLWSTGRVQWMGGKGSTTCNKNVPPQS